MNLTISSFSIIIGLTQTELEVVTHLRPDGSFSFFLNIKCPTIHSRQSDISIQIFKDHPNMDAVPSNTTRKSAVRSPGSWLWRLRVSGDNCQVENFSVVDGCRDRNKRCTILFWSIPVSVYANP